MAVHVVLTVLLWLRPYDVAAARLTSRPIVFSQRVPADVIVGRASCSGTVWLLNDAHQLIELVPATRGIAIHSLRGLHKDDAPWGLACLPDQTLWTLVTPRTIGHLARDGRIAERVSLPTPSLALFSVGPRLLLEPLPLVVASTVFTARPPQQASESRPWPGLNVRSASDHADLLKRNIVNCGLADGPSIPCWFAADARVSMSDGVHVDQRAFSLLRGAGIDASAPIRDVAAGRTRFWLLAAALTDGRRVAGPLFLTTVGGQEVGRLEPRPPLRVILTATDANCLVLNIQGEVVEVRQP